MSDSKSERGQRKEIHFPKIFQGYEFQFLGLSPENEEKYCKIVTDLGGKVSNHSGYALTTTDHVVKLLKSTNNGNNLVNVTRMYKILYILHSVEAKKALPIDLYRFESVKKPPELQTNKRTFQELLQEEQQEKFTKKPRRRIESSSSSEEEEEEDIIPASNNSISIKSKTELIHNGNTNNHAISESSDDCNENNANESNTRNNIINNSDNDSISSDDEDNSVFLDSSKWWITQEIPEKARCKENLCTFSPEIHKAHGKPQHTMSAFEQRIMLAFIIKFNAINKIKGGKIYKDMGTCGYLTHRTHETLRNNMRRTILPKINTFGLPTNLLKQFQDVALSN